jgi:endonuclease/exonuclease/phosphatase family metal-dependent hydrolase
VCAALVSAPVPPHLVVAGDLNEPENSPAWQVFARVVGDPRPGAAPTFPAQAPHGRIDAILVSRGLEALTYDDGGADLADVRRASDHLPVIAVLRRAPEHP